VAERGPDSSVSIANRIPVEVRFSAPVKAGPGAPQPPVQRVPGLSRG